MGDIFPSLCGIPGMGWFTTYCFVKKSSISWYPVLIWVVLNAAWFAFFAIYFFFICDDPTRCNNPFGRMLGHLNMLNMGLLLFPVSRDSVIQRFFSIPFEQALILHRNLARWLISVTLLHGFSWYAYWTVHTLTDTVCTDAPSCSFDFAWQAQALTGLITGLLMILVAVFALEIFRRWNFEWFYYTHHFFIGIIFMAIVHSLLVQEGWASDLLLYYLAPGLILYIFDRARRLYRSAKTKTNIFVLEDVRNGMTCLQLSFVGPFRAGQYFFLTCPQISRLQSHPYSAASSERELSVTFYIKSMGPETWSGELNKKAQSQSEDSGTDSYSDFVMSFQNVIDIKLDGPYGRPYLANKPRQQHFAFIGGGIGITPIVSILKTLLFFEKSPDPKEVPLSIHLVWIVKSPEEFLWFGGFLQELRFRLNNVLNILASVELFVTGNRRMEESIEYIPPQRNVATPYVDCTINSRSGRYSVDSESSLLIDKSMKQVDDGDYLQNIDDALERPFDILFKPNRPKMRTELERIQKVVRQRDPKAESIELLACGPHRFDVDVADASLHLAKEFGAPIFNYTSQTFML